MAETDMDDFDQGDDQFEVVPEIHKGEVLDDPIQLYLRDISREELLLAE